GHFSTVPGSQFQVQLEVPFRGGTEVVSLYRVAAKTPHNGVVLWALENPLFAIGGKGKIYCDDPADRPFASDASKFALFCAAVAWAVKEGQFGELDALHLHDWHGAMVAVLRAYDPNYQALQSLRSVYTIHNLALQGVRPLAGDASSLQAWFPGLNYDQNAINDPRAPHCINPMRAGINLCDRVHAVSPTYAEEIQQASEPERGYFGGEGLQGDLLRAAKEGRLCGILNGCEYPHEQPAGLTVRKLLSLCEAEVLKWLAADRLAHSAHIVALQRLQQLGERFKNSTRFPTLLTSVGRVTDQKALLLQQPLESGQCALDAMVEQLPQNGVLMILGSGTPELEDFLTRVSARQPRLVFLKGYSEALSQALYASGHLFVMPSSFEPCGISQMLSMRAGQPCLVHRVGGLNDTVENGVNGFSFSGDSLQQQATRMVERLGQALNCKRRSKAKWQAIGAAAGEARFLWSDVAQQYSERLYR
ncbi:MAG: glycogen/starch synthase, partial [Porticoccaceae bacterium]|nr:glycogen/starch synthase [Porticoccaceae bacterium]